MFKNAVKTLKNLHSGRRGCINLVKKIHLTLNILLRQKNAPGQKKIGDLYIFKYPPPPCFAPFWPPKAAGNFVVFFGQISKANDPKFGIWYPLEFYPRFSMISNMGEVNSKGPEWYSHVLFISKFKFHKINTYMKCSWNSNSINMNFNDCLN